ncbi:hypothetical protein B5S28_g780 [[Candida] boidinii]|nr:hypothetical protein B5S28_g780 [[Candida] boidinii]OWB72173.1 hypothetical protein B5S31_g1879 [[Candida] boidinii]GME88559.1 unnamed protein product [[Candida] boidinii]
MTKRLPPDVRQSRRPIRRACEFCHTKHLQCDDSRPCKNCTKRELQDSCRDMERRKSKKILAKEAKEAKDLKLKLDREELEKNKKLNDKQNKLKNKIKNNNKKLLTTGATTTDENANKEKSVKKQTKRPSDTDNNGQPIVKRPRGRPRLNKNIDNAKPQKQTKKAKQDAQPNSEIIQQIPLPPNIQQNGHLINHNHTNINNQHIQQQQQQNDSTQPPFHSQIQSISHVQQQQQQQQQPHHQPQQMGMEIVSNPPFRNVLVSNDEGLGISVPSRLSSSISPSYATDYSASPTMPLNTSPGNMNPNNNSNLLDGMQLNGHGSDHNNNGHSNNINGEHNLRNHNSVPINNLNNHGNNNHTNNNNSNNNNNNDTNSSTMLINSSAKKFEYASTDLGYIHPSNPNEQHQFYQNSDAQTNSNNNNNNNNDTNNMGSSNLDASTIRSSTRTPSSTDEVLCTASDILSGRTGSSKSRNFESNLANDEYVQLTDLLNTNPPSPSAGFFDFDEISIRPWIEISIEDNRMRSSYPNNGTPNSYVFNPKHSQMPNTAKEIPNDIQEEEDYTSPLIMRHIVKHPNDIYLTNTVKSYQYPKAYHALIHYLRKRFNREQLIEVAKCMAKYRPSFISATKSLYENDLIFTERSFQRTLLEYENLISNCPSPTIIWRRTGEIVALTNEFAIMTGYSKMSLLSKRTFIVELMDDESTIKYFKSFSNMAFGDLNATLLTDCVLRKADDFDYLKCACVWTIKRDVFDIPMLIVGQFLPILD